MKQKTGKKIIFVCTGNTCRSPMAERLLETLLEQEKIRGFRVYSAGIRATKGTPMNEKSAQVLEEHGISALEFASATVKDRDLRDAFAIVCMTESHKDVLMDMRWQALRKADKIGDEEIANNIYSFAEMSGYEVMDPYGKDIECYRYVFGLLAAGMPRLVQKLRLRELGTKSKPRTPKPPQTDEQGNPLPPKKRGRPKKNPDAPTKAEPKKRGRPKKAAETSAQQLSIDDL